MKYISLKEKNNGRIRKNKEYSLQEFVLLCEQMVPVKVTKPNKPFFVSKKKWNLQGKHAYQEGYTRCLIEIIGLINKEIDNDNINTTHKRKKRDGKGPHSKMRGKLQ